MPPSIFISYLNEDSEAIEVLDSLLSDNGYKVWRDQKSLYGGDAWPKLIGDAILENDFFILCWSKNAKASHYVELEWTTAIALKKPVIPYLLDDTPLPATLRSYQVVKSQKDLEVALKRPIPRREKVEEKRVIEKLEKVKDSDPIKILEEIKVVGKIEEGKKWFLMNKNHAAIIGAIGLILIISYGWFTVLESNKADMSAPDTSLVLSPQSVAPDIDGELYSKKKEIANDLINSQGGMSESCAGTNFGDIISLQNTLALANQASRLSRSEAALQWQNAIDSSTIKQDSLDSPKPPNIEDPLFLSHVDHLLLIDENFARFRITSFRPQHFQFIQLNYLDARDATLLVDAIGRVTTGENIPKVYNAHSIILIYYLTQGHDDVWRCIHVHPSYNPITVNDRFQSDYDECDFLEDSTFGVTRAVQKARCQQRVIQKYERVGR